MQQATVRVTAREKANIASNSEHKEELVIRDITIRLKVAIILNDNTYWHVYFSLANTL